MKYLVVLDVEPKSTDDGESIDDDEYPTMRDLVERLNNVLQDVTKHDEMIDWRVTNVSHLDRNLIT